MTDEQINDMKVFCLAYATLIAIGGDSAAQVPFSHLVSYVNSLLAAKDATIAALQARPQVTEAMMTVYAEYARMRFDPQGTYYPSEYDRVERELTHQLKRLIDPDRWEEWA